MLQAVELPATIANLGSGLTDVDGDALTLKENDRVRIIEGFECSSTSGQIREGRALKLALRESKLRTILW